MAKSTTKCYGNNILFLCMNVYILCRTVSMMFVDMCLHDVCIECLHVVIYACMRNYLCTHYVDMYWPIFILVLFGK